MKQHITLDQIKTLNSKGKSNYKKLQSKFGWFDSQMTWLNDKVYFLNIGQLIEILNSEDKSIHEYWIGFIMDCSQDSPCPLYKGELCNALWKEVKEILET